MNESRTLSKLASLLISSFDKQVKESEEKKISVNSVVAEIASWYEKIRTAMDYREDEVILRSSIERILKRRFLLGGNGKYVAGPLIRELVWARYFPDSSVPETIVADVEKIISRFLKLQEHLYSLKILNRQEIREWILQLMSSDIEDVLRPERYKELMSNFIYQIFQDDIEITDDSEETKNAQVFIAVRRAYAKEDLALLRYHLFCQYFGKLTDDNVEQVADNFLDGFNEINKQLNYPLKDRIYSYVRNQIPPFYILEDVLRNNKGQARFLVSDEDEFDRQIIDAAASRYKSIVDKVKRAVVRSVIFIFVTKMVFTLAVEGAFESLIYGKIFWPSILLNTLVPPGLMTLAGVFIKTPGKENTKKILDKIHRILYQERPQLDHKLILKKTAKKVDPLLDILFVALWMIAFTISFGATIFILTKLHFNAVSQGVFVFFLAIVSFLAYRINQTAHVYTIKDQKEGINQVLFDFFFMPFIQAGRNLTMGISQINIFLFLFDYIIEAPFKSLFAFFEQWFLYLRTQREKLE
ncbi:hypothetical protein HYW42_04580 [Candidatus Daviesbacteria bacterium]|nr:hypothetical protein [Candidatus Daviesbacteria bacterium]